MSNDLVTALTEVAARVIELAGGDEELRSRLRAVARAFLAATEPVESALEKAADATRPVTAEACPSGPSTPLTHSTPSSRSAASSHLAVADTNGAAERAPVAVPAAARIAGPSLVLGIREQRDDLWEVATGAGRGAAHAPAGDWAEVTDDDLEMIEKRLRIKAEGARWAATRRRRVAEGADYRVEIDPLDRELIEKAKSLPDCFLWMNHPSGPSPSDLSLLDDLAGCFDAAAGAIGLVRGLLGDSAAEREALEQSLELLAEAQSALRSAVEKTEGRPDKDQFKAYQWLRAACSRMKIFIQRHMRAEDPADPTSWPDIDGRVEALNSRLVTARERGKQFRSSLKRVRYHLKLILEQKGGGTEGGSGGVGVGGRNLLHDWKIVMDTVDQMVRDGLPPSNADVRDLLLPVIDSVPEMETPGGFERVMREIDRFVASRAATSDAAAPETGSAPTAEVAAAADLLRGKTMVLIGGARRREAHDALKAAFELKELDWVETREHESVTVFEPHVARPDVALVILAIRWSSHAFADVKQYCDRYGKPLVRLPAGYNPNQVAVHVLGQCSGKLGGA